MGDDINDKTIKNIPFSGKKANYEMWSKRFLSYAQLKKVKKVLLKVEKPPKHDAVLDPNVTADKEKIRIRTANEITYNLLMLAMQDDVSFEAVSSACTDDLPDGDAALAWEHLESINSKKCVAMKGELKAAFYGLKLKKDISDTEIWFTKLDQIIAKLKIDYKYMISEEDHLEHDLNSLPADYDGIVELIQVEIETNGTIDLN
jgi:hypothetical protein